MRKKVYVIGAGVSGLSAGIYAARCGFDVTILEQHFTFGGLSTSWSRKGYFFEGGMHWLTGSGEDQPLNKVWKQLGALQENNPVENKEILYSFVDKNGKQINLWRDIEKTRQEFLQYSPEDKNVINTLYNDVKKYTKVHLPVADLPGLKSMEPMHPSIKELLAMIPAGIRTLQLSNTSFLDYINRFKNKDLRELLKAVTSNQYNATSFLYTMASFACGDSGFPKGGSIQFVKNMVDTFESLGGEIQYKTTVEKVVVKNGITTGVQTKDGFLPADAVIVSQDFRQAVDTLFDVPISSKFVQTMKKNLVPEENTFICLGVKADLSHLPHTCIFPLEKPFECANNFYSHLRVNNYSRNKEAAPEGCTSVTSILIGESYDYWKAAKEDGTYKAKKDELAQRFIKELEAFVPEIKDNIEVIDVATPCTYERYCSSYHGSWMSVWCKGTPKMKYPHKLPEIQGCYFAGQRLQMPGGLPIAGYTGRMAVQHLCKDTETIFV